jgi:hypothetical protein
MLPHSPGCCYPAQTAFSGPCLWRIADADIIAHRPCLQRQRQRRAAGFGDMHENIVPAPRYDHDTKVPPLRASNPQRRPWCTATKGRLWRRERALREGICAEQKAKGQTRFGKGVPPKNACRFSTAIRPIDSRTSSAAVPRCGNRVTFSIAISSGDTRGSFS